MARTPAVKPSKAKMEHRYRPYGTAKDIWSCRDAEVLVSGPAGTGKSRACLEKLHAMCLLNPDMRGLIVRKTLASLGSTALVTFREHVAIQHLLSGEVSFFGGSPQHPPQYRYANGATITIGGMDKPAKIMSSEYDMVYVQEATELNLTDWESITTRLRNGKVSFQQLMADCNPDAPHHWLKQRCDEGRCTIIYSKHADNPVLYEDTGELTVVGKSYIAKLDALTGVRRDRLFLGKWVAAEGQVYESYDPEVHVVDGWPTTPPRSWERYWVVDFGFTNPFVLQCWASDPDGRLYLYREIYRTQRLVEDHAKDILSIVRTTDGTWKEPRPKVIICDHDAEDRATLERYIGMGTVAATKTVSDGIQAVQTRLKVEKDGKPRLFFCRNALVAPDPELKDSAKPISTIDEIAGYVWDTAATNSNARDQNNRENPLKKDDHGMDCVRYMVAYLDLVGMPRLRWLG